MKSDATDRPLDFSGLTEAERVEVSTATVALAGKVGDVRARRWARRRINEIRESREQEAP